MCGQKFLFLLRKMRKTWKYSMFENQPKIIIIDKLTHIDEQLNRQMTKREDINFKDWQGLFKLKLPPPPSPPSIINNKNSINSIGTKTIYFAKFLMYWNEKFIQIRNKNQASTRTTTSFWSKTTFYSSRPFLCLLFKCNKID